MTFYGIPSSPEQISPSGLLEAVTAARQAGFRSARPQDEFIDAFAARVLPAPHHDEG